MKHLFLKTFRDVKNYWTQFLGVFFMTLISITIYAGMAVVGHGLDVSVEQYVNESNLADQWIYTTGITDEDMRRFENDEGVQEATYACRLRADVKGGHQFLELTALSNDTFMKSHLVEGEAFDPESGGLWLDNKFAQENSLKPGDAIIIEYADFEKEFEIKGLVLNIEKMLFTGSNLLTIPDHKTFGYAFIGKESLNELIPLYPYTEMRLGNGQSLSDDTLESVLGDRFLFSEMREDKDFLEEVAKESNQMMKMSILFSLVFVLLSTLTMYSSMSRLITNQRTIIGTMKALGIEAWKIKLHYGLYGVIIATIGSVCGLFLGPAIVPPILIGVKETYITLPYWHTVHHKSVYLIIAGLIFTCTYASIKNTRKLLKKAPAEILRNTHNMDVVLKKGLLERFDVFWSRLPNGLKWSLRDNSRNKVRFLMGVVGVVGGMVLLVAGLGVTKSIEHANEYIFTEQSTYSYISEIKMSRHYEEAFQDICGEQEFCLMLPGTASKGDKKRNIAISAGENKGLLIYKDLDGNAINLDSGDVLITRKLARQLAVDVGDVVKVDIKGIGEEELKVTKITSNISPQGIVMAKEKYEKYFADFMPNLLLTKDARLKDLEENGLTLFTATRDHQLRQANILAESVEAIMYILILASVVLVVVIIYTLSTLNYIERERDYATLRVLGFRKHEIRNILLNDSILTVLLGWIVGVFTAAKFLDIYLKVVSLDSVEWVAYLDSRILALATIIVVGVSFSVVFILSSRIRKIDLVASFKSVE